MMFSKSFEYALKAVIHLYIETKDGTRLNIKDLSAAIDSPEPFTAKILQALARRKIISSVKGPGGGFYINPKAKPIPIYEVLEAIDGHAVFERCGLGLKECSNTRPCPIHDEFKSYSNRLNNLFKKKTVQELAVSISKGKTFVTNE